MTSTLTPDGDAEFDDVLDTLVSLNTPRLFAVVQVYGDCVDARIAAWGMAHDDHADVVSADGGLQLSLACPENALPAFTRGHQISTRLVWPSPEAGQNHDS